MLATQGEWNESQRVQKLLYDHVLSSYQQVSRVGFLRPSGYGAKAQHKEHEELPTTP